MTQIVFYTNPFSRGRSVRWMLEECGADYQTVPVQYGAEMKSPDYLAVNPMGKSPALKYGDTVITETAAILTFLAEQFPDKNLIPAPATAERGEFYRWLFFALHAEYAIMDQWFGTPKSAERSRAIGYGSFQQTLHTLESLLTTRKYAVGDHFTALDLYLSGLIGWGIERGQVLPAEGVLADYMKPHFARPAFLRAQELDNALAKEMGLV